MQTSSPRFKSLAVTAGFSFWFFILTSAAGVFSLEIFVIFVVALFSITQLFAKKISKGLDIFAKFNTKFFLATLFIFVIAIYGIAIKLLRIDILRLKKQDDTYWLEIENSDKLGKQY
tara:strand:+ start:140 stop:490 length:351 start_codon:yes stop_codon:yes gene_type:complete